MHPDELNRRTLRKVLKEINAIRKLPRHKNLPHVVEDFVSGKVVSNALSRMAKHFNLGGHLRCKHIKRHNGPRMFWILVR